MEDPITAQAAFEPVAPSPQKTLLQRFERAGRCRGLHPSMGKSKKYMVDELCSRFSKSPDTASQVDQGRMLPAGTRPLQ